MGIHLDIHHIRFAVEDVIGFSHLLQTQLQFSHYASRCSSSSPQSAQTMILKHQDAIFIIDKLEEDTNKNDFCWGNNAYPVNTVCDVCLECCNIEEILKNALLYDRNCVVTDLTSIEDEFGILKYAVLKPPIGNVQHTLINLSEYHGLFLPKFKLTSTNSTGIDAKKPMVPGAQPGEERLKPLLHGACMVPKFIQTIDHVAYVLNMGQTNEVLQWYLRCMNFSRLIVNVDEDEREGFVVKEGLKGLKLKAIFSPHHLSNKCIAPLSKIQPETPKFVLAEGLSDNYQTDKSSFFLHMHHGPGVQHIAFGTNDIVESVSQFKKQGLSCVLPPAAYYNEVSNEIQKLKYEVETLQTNNIIVESHLTLPESLPSYDENSLDIEEQIKAMKSTQWFIMQVFTKPVFDEKTFFFEIIQRFQTKSAFGASSINAIWKAMGKEILPK